MPVVPFVGAIFVEIDVDGTIVSSSVVVPDDGAIKGPTYSITSATTPDPTVRPPSRIAKRSSLSIAIGVIS